LALYYLDTSALVKLNIREQGTDRLLRLASRASNHRFAVLALAQVEFHSAIRKRERLGDIDAPIAAQVLGRFERHLEGKFLRQVVSDAVLDNATALVDRYPLRAYDAIQLAGCMAFRAASGGQQPVFVCADRQLLDAAGCEGLEFLDPGE
jgi:predicted nucleic acid-binding protein